MRTLLIKFILASVLLVTISKATELRSFSEVQDVILDRDSSFSTISPDDLQKARSEMAVYDKGHLPQYEMNLRSIFEFGSSSLEQAAKRTMDDKSDYLDRLPKLLHPNGVCISGQWQIFDNSTYTGAFASGAKNLFVGRISVAMQETKSDSRRGFGFAGKLFPTMNDHEKVPTENLFTVDVLMGTNAKRFLDVATTNEPEMGFDLWLVKLGLKIASALTKGDANPGFRPLKNLAQLGHTKDTAPKIPHWIRLSAAENTIKNNLPDFRSEILQATKDNTELVFHIDVSDTTKDRKSSKGWVRIGEIRTNQASVSYGCDRRLHFAHPKLK